MSDINEYVVSVGNLMLGIYKYMVLTLPSGWRLSRSEMPPEIDYTAHINGVDWVLEGISYHYIHDGYRQATYQLSINCKRGLGRLNISTKGLSEAATGEVEINGHACVYISGVKQVGFTRKKRLYIIRVLIDCEDTKRSIELALTALNEKRPDTDLFLRSLSLSKCHQLKT